MEQEQLSIPKAFAELANDPAALADIHELDGTLGGGLEDE